MKFGKHIFTGLIALWALFALVMQGRTAPRTPQPPWPEETLRIFGFDSPYARVPWRNLAWNEEDATLGESWSGFALRREGFVSAPVIVPMRAADGSLNLAPAYGAIRFWFAPNWSTAAKRSGGTGPGHPARLLELVQLSGEKAHTRWSLFLNEAGDTLSLAGETKLGAKVLCSAPVKFTAGDWRMISVLYSETNVVLQLDTETIAKAEGLAVPAAWEEKDLGLVIGSDVWGAPDSLAEGQFEELTMKRRWPQKADWQEMYFKSGKRRSLLGPQGTKEEEQAKVLTLQSAGLLPLEYGMEPQNLEEGGGLEAYNYAAGSLWLEITGVSNNLAYLILHGTEADVPYEILSKEALTNAEWASEPPIVTGATGQDWTPTTVPVGLRTNQLFLSARVLSDGDGDGLPDWWELVHGLDPNNPDTGNTGVPDSYKDSDNDGWTNLQEYQNGTSPGRFNTPPPPRNVIARLDATGTNVIMTWESGGGPVTSYDIEYNENAPIVQSLAASTRTVTFALDPFYLANAYSYTPSMAVRAHFPNGSAVASATVPIKRPNIEAAAVRGADCVFHFVPRALPADLVRIHFSYSFFNFFTWQTEHHSWFDLYPTNLISLRYPMPPENPYGALMFYECVFADGSLSAPRQFSMSASDGNDADKSDWEGIRPHVFVDARPFLKENLRFLLRSATVTQPFSYWSGFYVGLTNYSPDADIGGTSYFHVRPSHMADYECSGYRLYDLWKGHSVLMAARPITDHYLWQNFIYHPDDFHVYGHSTNGVFIDWLSGDGRSLESTVKYFYPVNLTNVPALAFNAASSTWLYATSSAFEWEDVNADVGLTVTMNWDIWQWQFSLAANTRNYFGLPLRSLRIGDSELFFPGTTFEHEYGSMEYFPDFEPPQLQTVDYYFASQSAALEQIHSQQNDVPPPPLPGAPTFSATNTSPVLITGVGQSIAVSGWAKQAILNGYADKFAYLEQYFDKALTMANGAVTTNETGILSPYGEFFPTEPGCAALVTMPDIETNERGTAIVHVVSLNVDANHDGVMDLSFGGPDNTSATKPFAFWVNNDFDRWHEVDCVPLGDCDNEEDDVNVYDPAAKGADPAQGFAADCDFRSSAGVLGIPSKRDLEDYARLWLSGVASLYAAKPNLVFELSIRSSSTEGPALNIFQATETDGGTRYLSEESTSDQQIAPTLLGFFARVSPNKKLMLNNLFVLGGVTNEHFIFCGAQAGTGELVLQIKDGTNLLAETSAWIEFQDIKQMYERWTLGDVGSMPPFPTAILATDGLPSRTTAFSYGPEVVTNTPYILHVHGWNMEVWEKDRYGETMFKRLYWQGYEGRFGILRWPTLNKFPSASAEGADPNHFDKSELNAWKSGVGLRDLLVKLNNKHPGRVFLTGHSMGNVVAGEALRTNVTLINTYVAMEAAVPAHAYDAATPTRSIPFPEDDETPNRYAHYWQNDSQPYFSGVAGASNYVNFYNTNDFAFAPSAWPLDQNMKPAESIGYNYDKIADKFYKGVGELVFPANTHELFAFCVEARCNPLGTQPNVGGAFNTAQQVDLAGPPYNFGTEHKYHSGQFRSTNMKRAVFWERFLIRTALKEE